MHVAPHREHRSGVRVALSGVEIDGPGPIPSETWSTSGGDVSTGGVGFTLSAPVSVEVGDRITVRLYLPDALEPLLVRAEVRHVHRDGEGNLRAGAHFLDADELVAFPVFRYVEESMLAIRATTGGFA